MLGLLIGGVSSVTLYLISNGNEILSFIGTPVIVLTYFQTVVNRNIKLLRPKVRKLVQNNKAKLSHNLGV